MTFLTRVISLYGLRGDEVHRGVQKRDDSLRLLFTPDIVRILVFADQPKIFFCGTTRDYLPGIYE